MNERILRTLIKQDELFQCFAIGRDIGEAQGEARGLQEGKALGLQESKNLGFQEGSQQKQHDMILEMHKHGLPIDLISDISKLSESEVKEIINNTNTKEKS